MYVLFFNSKLSTLLAEVRKKIKELSDVSTSHLVTKQEGAGGILPHYDDHSYKTQEIEVE